MKRFLLISFMGLLTLTAFGQGKLISSSEDKRPAWIKKNVDRYDVMKVSCESTVSLEDARGKAFEELHSSVVNSVTSYLMQTHIEGADAGKVRQEAENSSFVRNISESTALDVYWEHRLVKKQDLYIYYILYNFNDNEKKKAALEINMGNFQKKHSESF